MFLEINNITAYKANRRILHDFSLQINRGEIIGLAGETGSGKSSLLAVIGGLETCAAGEVLLEKNKMPHSHQMLIPGYPEMAYMTQHTALMNHYRVHEMLNYKGKMDPAAVAEIIDLCSIGNLLQRWTHELSGGEKQRVALAFSMTADPKILLLDEPFSHLDRPQKIQLSLVLKTLNLKKGITVCLASHDAEELMTLCDKIAVIKEGRLLQLDRPDHLFYSPVDSYSAALLGDYSVLESKTLNLPEIQLKNKTADQTFVFLRPNQLKLAQEPNATLCGVVLESIFAGSFFRSIIRTSSGECILHSHEMLHAGVTVFLNIDCCDFHFL